MFFFDTCMAIVKVDYIWPVDPIFAKIIVLLIMRENNGKGGEVAITLHAP